MPTEQKTVVITGCAGGIGSAAARVFREAGWFVYGLDIAPLSPPANTPAADAYTETHTGVDCYFQADVSDPADVDRMVQRIAEEHQRVYALVNNAAVQVRCPLVETTQEQWTRTMRVNVGSVHLLVKKLHPMLCGHTAAVVNVSSVHAVVTSERSAAYAASKGAMTALTRAMAIELAPDNIRVNAVLPGAVDTPMLRDGLARTEQGRHDPEAALKELGRRTVMHRIGQPHEIAQAIYFLADDGRSSYITGQMLIVDGGATARLSTE